MVVHIEDFSNVYVQRRSNKESIDSLYNDMATFYHSGQGEPVDHVKTGGCYIAQFSEDNEWYRAQVLSTDGDMITVTKAHRVPRSGL